MNESIEPRYSTYLVNPCLSEAQMQWPETGDVWHTDQCDFPRRTTAIKHT